MNSRLVTSTIGVALLLGLATGMTVTACQASEVYIQQARGTVAPGSSVITKATPETTPQPNQQPAATPAPTAATAPDTCNAQNASSSQACYTATQQARPASR